MAVEEIIDRLYGLPLSEFTRARNQAASQLRKAGRREEAERVKALRKPTAAAAAVNRLVREHRGEVEQFLHTAAMLREAQLAGTGDLAAATKEEREALEELTRTGGEPVRQTLLAAAVDDEAAGQLRAARLEHELEPRGFGTLLAHARATTAKRKPPSTARTQPRQAPPAKPKPAPPKPRKPDDRAARAGLEDAKAALSAARSAEQEARRRWTQAQTQLERAAAAVEKAQRELDRLHHR